jgi:hypothetical protein
MIRKIGVALAGLVGSYLELALGLAFWPTPGFDPPDTVRKIGVTLAGLAGLYLALALGLTFWPTRGFDHPAAAERRAARETAACRPRAYEMRDGVSLYRREFDPPGATARTVVLLVHAAHDNP